MGQKIQWICQGVEMPEIDFAEVESWIGKVAADHHKIVGPMTYIFCNDQEILDVNLKYLQHDFFTDIITFDYSRGRIITGDIFMSLDTVRSNAQQLGQPYGRELFRVIIHGVLHLCGINDKGPGEREIMEAAEDAALAKLTLDYSEVN